MTHRYSSKKFNVLLCNRFDISICVFGNMYLVIGSDVPAVNRIAALLGVKCKDCEARQQGAAFQYNLGRNDSQQHAVGIGMEKEYRQNGRYFTDDIFKRVFLNENYCVFIRISLKYVLSGPNINMPALVQMMAWRRTCDKPSSEPILA